MTPLGVSPAGLQPAGTLLTVTLNPALDRCGRVVALESERKLHCTDVTVEPGGGGVNVARMATRLGLRTTAAVLMGGDGGDRLVRLLQAEGVSVVALATSEAVREDLTIVETSTGRHYRFVLPGAEVRLNELAAAARDIVGLAKGAGRVVVSGSLPPGVSDAAFGELLRDLRAAGAELLVDVPGPSLAAAAQVGAQLLKPSAHELSAFAGAELSGEEELEQAARDLLALGPNEAVVVSLGGAGALFVPAAGEAWRLHAPAVRSVSTVGAGDSLVAGVAVALACDWTTLDAARLGVAAGTASTTRAGSGLAHAPDVRRLLPHVTSSLIQHGDSERRPRQQRAGRATASAFTAFRAP
jgi:6-phosphofructokinase 2